MLSQHFLYCLPHRWGRLNLQPPVRSPGWRRAGLPGPSGTWGCTIHRSAWNKNSRKFKVASDTSTQRQPLDNRPWCTPLGSKHLDLVAVVAPMCIKGLRLATMELPEKLSPIGLGTNRISHIRLSRKFELPAATKGCCSVASWRLAAFRETCSL